MRCHFCGEQSKSFRMVAEPPIPRKAFPGVDWFGKWVEWCGKCVRANAKPAAKPTTKRSSAA